VTRTNSTDFNLTSQEIKVLKYIGHGATNHEIAQKLSIAKSTVRSHVHNIRTKLRITERALPVYAFKNRLVLLKDLRQETLMQ